MTQLKHPTAPIPDALDTVFRGSIRHPLLWLWDSWTMWDNGALHLYCLALSRTAHDGSAIRPPQRNDHGFHVRHFVSTDAGSHWRDLGAVLTPGMAADGADQRNVWSGSVTRLADGDIAFGYTGVREMGDDRRFLQTICVGLGSWPGQMDRPPAAAISCPLRDYDMIRDTGYYLAPKPTLGAAAGEEGGPILAWRDPFLLEGNDGTLHAFWSAKTRPIEPAIAHATLVRRGGELVLEKLFPPVTLPDGADFTQAEVPKVYPDPASGGYLLLISACSRMFEGQPDSDVRQEQRLYRAPTLAGPWVPAMRSGSLVRGLETLFGASIIAIDRESGAIDIMGPYTENAGGESQLSFSAKRTVDLKGLCPSEKSG